MTDPKLIEAVARALEPKCRGFGAGDMPMAVAREFAQSAITAYEAARGDGVWVMRDMPKHVAGQFEDTGRYTGHDERTGDTYITDAADLWDDMLSAMIAAAKGE
jgi:hypothetical protein